jgi:uncharacterized protein YecE (DUF72 family)
LQATKQSEYMNIHAGTSGFSYKEWKGSFYPADIKADAMLRFYGERFDTVEINNTFYRMPNASLLEQWATQVGESFHFVLKAPQRITHQKRLHNVADDVSYFFATATALDPRLGPSLFQLPPFLKKDIESLKAFLALVPAGRRVALEFRHASWFDEEVYASLRSANAALCAADTDEEPLTEIQSTSDWGYLRLRRTDYDETAIAAWADRVRAQSWSDAFVFFKHEDEGRGPAYARTFLDRIRSSQ